MPKTTKSDDIKALTVELKDLKNRVNKLEKKQPTTKSTKITWRTVAVVLLAGTAGALLILANLLFWTGRTLVEADLYKDATRSIIQQPAVQKAVADRAGNAIFERVNVEDLLVEALPPKAQFAAPTIASQVETTTRGKIREIVASKKFEDIWVNVNTKSHDRFIKFIRNYEGDGTINISDVYAKLVQRLQGTNLAFLSQVSLPSSIGTIQLVDAQWLPTAHWVVKYLDTLRVVTIGLFILLSVLIVYISRQRHSVAAKLGVFYAVLMLLTLVAVRLGREFAVSQVDSFWRDAATQAWQALLSPFVMQTTGLLVLSLVIALIAWATGSGKRAKRVQQAANDIFNGKFHKALFKKENSYTRWVGKYLVTLQWTAVLLAFILLLVISVSIANILWLIAALLIVSGAIQVSAAN
ncbi:MAG: hypothetical protein Q7T74_00815 [Candidatus Saccharibacteria bacterium]|nr:hypothetical protein [Candidatus Saccharibacteria bacterium]